MYGLAPAADFAYRRCMLQRFLAAALLAAVSGCSPSAGDPQVEVDAPWVRPALAAGRTSAAYFSVHNRGNGDDRLLAVTSEVAGRTTLHSSSSEGGIARMRPLTDGLPIPAGETVNLAPGGNHVMLEQLKRPLNAGEKIALTLSFERWGARQVEAQVGNGSPDGGADAHSGH